MSRARASTDATGTTKIRQSGVLVVGFNYAAVDEEEFNEWYDTEHIPERARLEGFIGCERWLGAEDSKLSVATYGLETLDALQNPAFLAIGGKNVSPWSKRIIAKCQRICRLEGGLTASRQSNSSLRAGALLMWAANVVTGRETDFDEWFNGERIALLSRTPGCLTARHFVCKVGSHRYLALYELTSAETVNALAWRKAENDPIAESMRPLLRDSLRLVLNRYEQQSY